MELQHPVHDVVVALSHEVFVVLPSVPGVAGVEPDPPETLSRDHRPCLLHLIDQNVVEILVVTPGHHYILYPAVRLVYPILRVVPGVLHVSVLLEALLTEDDGGSRPAADREG